MSEIKQSKGGRPKKKDNVLDEPIVVKKIEFNGVKFLKDKKNGNIYDYDRYMENEDQTIIGKWNNETNKIDFFDNIVEPVKKIEVNGKKYLKSKWTGDIYDYDYYKIYNIPVTIGKWNDETNTIDFNENADKLRDPDNEPILMSFERSNGDINFLDKIVHIAGEGEEIPLWRNRADGYLFNYRKMNEWSFGKRKKSPEPVGYWNYEKNKPKFTRDPTL